MTVRPEAPRGPGRTPRAPRMLHSSSTPDGELVRTNTEPPDLRVKLGGSTTSVGAVTRLDPDTRPDPELLHQHLAQDPQAFNELVRRHRVALWVVALRILGDQDDAQDAVQMALLRAFRAARTYRGDSEVLSWLRSIVENVSKTLSRTRDRNGREVVGLPTRTGEIVGAASVRRGLTGAAAGAAAAARCADQHRTPEQTVMRFAEAEELLGRLDEPFRRTFILVKVRGFSYAEAAAIEQVEVGTIRSRLARAKATLLSHRSDDS